MPNPVQYAEDTLGVHTILEGVIKARDDLDEVLTTLATARDNKRKAEQDLADREMELSIEARGKHADMSQAAMDKHLKTVFFQDAQWKQLRDSVRELTNDVDGAEMDRKLNERDIEIGNARMIELGGYLNYLAAVKNATATKRSEA